MTRTSIPSLLSNLVKSAFRKEAAKSTSGNVYWALRDISFELKKGEGLALVGANGAGKTTVLKLLAKITKPSTGEIITNGRLSALIELGAGFHPDLSGRENVYLNGTILGLKKQEIDRQFDKIVSFAGLEQFIDTPVKRYSSGMTVRLGFAVAASMDPDILLVDEVLAVGDTAFRLKCMNRIQELIKNGTTLVFVSHNMGLIKSVCPTSLYIDKGNAKFFGATNEAIELYNKALNEQRINEFKTPQEAEVAKSDIAEITKIDVSGIGIDRENVLKTNLPARITINYQAFQDIKNARLALRIVRSDGTYCSVIYSNIDGFPINIEQGKGNITITLEPIQLFPGTYSVVATLKNSLVSLSMAYSGWFYVESDMIGYEDMDAIFEPNRVWNHNQGESAAQLQQPADMVNNIQ